MRSLINSLLSFNPLVVSLRTSLKHLAELIFTLCLGEPIRESSQARCLICGAVMCERDACALPLPTYTSISLIVDSSAGSSVGSSVDLLTVDPLRRELVVASALSSRDPRWIHLITAKRGDGLDGLYTLSRRLSDHLTPELDRALSALERSSQGLSQGLSQDLSQGLSQRQELTQRVVLCPIPVRRSSVSRRGVSPQHLFALALCESLERAHVMTNRERGSSSNRSYRVLDLMRRVQATPSQRGLMRLERAHAQSGSLSVERARDDVRSRVVILIDDVVTTGGTLREGARALFEAGARSVLGVTMFAVLDPLSDPSAEIN